ncbi:MAG: efflux RND transporter periplasmic adaptor subunit [Chloroflexi bacterium]|nr:efflux RND transporter periplasmic adaptor subunit [Chloroflexota bacterium]
MKKILVITFVILSIFVAACGGGTPAAGSATKIPVVADSGTVIAEGRLQPKQYATISFAVGGQIAEVLVSEGASVKKDEVIARLKSREAALAEVARSEAEKVNAEIALKNLKDNSDVASAQALLELARAKDQLDKAEKDLRNFKNPDMDYYQRQVAKAEDALKSAQENLKLLDISTASANVKLAKDALKSIDDNIVPDTLKDIKTCLNSPCADKQVVWLGGKGVKLQDARDWYNDALNRVTTTQIQLEQSQRNNGVSQRDLQKTLDDAKQNLKEAQTPDVLKVAVYEGEVAKAKSAVAEAQRKYDKVKSGAPDPDQLASLQARVNTATSSLDAAKVALANTELKAPFAGTVAEIKFKVGEQVAPNQAIVTMADFSKWIVKTNNLTEIEVVKVTQGQKATVKLDAMPETKLNGTVESVATFFEEKRGDITYTITVGVTNLDPKMRWGMTAQVTFEK